MLKMLAVAAAIPQQKKVCQDSLLDQKDDRSSMAKSRPPMGALKAAATPAATPAVVKDRLMEERQSFIIIFIESTSYMNKIFLH